MDRVTKTFLFGRKATTSLGHVLGIAIFAISKPDAMKAFKNCTLYRPDVKFISEIDPTNHDHNEACITTEKAALAIRNRNRELFGEMDIAL